MKNQVLILNSFDRSGSSAIIRTLAKHPDIESFFQPFNSGSVREKMYKIWDDTVASEDDYKFFRNLEQGYLNQDYIKSQWFYKYSTAQKFDGKPLYIIKTTLNHFTADWMQNNFPKIGMWAIWRDPFDILSSILRNEFYHNWYLGAIEEISTTVNNNISLKDFRKFLPKLNSPSDRSAFLIAVRNYYLFKNIEKENVLYYHKFKDNPDLELSKIINRYNLSSTNFYDYAKGKDLNISGKGYKEEMSFRDIIPKVKLPLITDIFAPLLELYNNKFLYDDK